MSATSISIKAQTPKDISAEIQGGAIVVGFSAASLQVMKDNSALALTAKKLNLPGKVVIRTGVVMTGEDQSYEDALVRVHTMLLGMDNVKAIELAGVSYTDELLRVGITDGQPNMNADVYPYLYEQKFGSVIGTLRLFGDGEGFTSGILLVPSGEVTMSGAVTTAGQQTSSDPFFASV